MTSDRDLDPSAPAGDTPRWQRRLADALASGPDPQGARGRADRILEAAAPDPTDERAEAATVAVLVASCAVAPFLASWLVRRPAWLGRLAAEDYDAPPDAAALRARLAQTRAERGDEPPETWLRHFKYYELARITVRDAWDEKLPLARSGETLEALSALADVLLEEAEACAREEVVARLGPPRFEDGAGEPHELRFCVLGLGKLGSRELNYSSDVDLVYVHESTPDGVARGGPDGLSPVEYFTRIAQRFGAIVGATTEDGFLYRIDLDLRPSGAQGAMVISDEAFGRYFEGWADTWEKAAFMKARPVAGDAGLGWRSLRELAPLLYRSTMDFEGVRGIRRLKDRIEEERGSEAGGFDVKVGAGGIRDVEFVAQALQLLHGGRIPQLRERSTQRTLEQLATLGLLARDDETALGEAYRFLRRVENRLQMEREQQTHRVPDDAAARERIARAVGYRDDPEGGEGALERFDADLAAHRARNRTIFAGLLPAAPSEQALELLARGAPALIAMPTTRAMIEDLAQHFGRAIGEASRPERALNNLARFAEGIGRHRSYYELLLDRPELVGRLVALFDGSDYLSGLLSSHPGLIEPVFSDPDVLLLSRDELESDLEALRSGLAESLGDEEGGLDALRRFQRRQIINVGLLDLSERVDDAAIGAALTQIAEVCAHGALALAEEQLAWRRAKLDVADRLGFLIVGMGKLGTHELGYGSDLDVIFLYDVADATNTQRLEAGEYAARLAQRWIGALQTTTAEGSCYEIDARLRPSGNQGVLVTSLAGFEDYHRGGGGEAWERQALLRARPVAGDPALAERFEAIRRDVLRQPIDDDVRDEIHRIRMRMEDEIARETGGRRDFKTGRGGVLDVECIVQYRQLLSLREYPELCDTVPLAGQLERLETLGLLGDEDATALREGWAFLSRLSRRLRIVENRSISDLDAERGDLEDLALRLGYESRQREGGARRALLADYRRHTEAIRAVYASTFGDAG